MDTQLALHPKQWNLIISPSQKRLLIAIACLAHDIPLMVLDCGRQFDSSVVARAAHGRQEIIDRIKIQRAFTCYEAVKLLERTPAEKTPIVILDFLSTFYDENVKISTRKFLLENSLRHFQRLGHGAGLAVSVRPSYVSEDALSLFERLQSTAPHISVYEPVENTTSQLRLF
jgi:hypothetical protein